MRSAPIPFAVAQTPAAAQGCVITLPICDAAGGLPAMSAPDNHCPDF